MLVLSRRQGESIIIGGEIVVTIIEVRGGQVRIGIDAPRNVDVHREEIYQEVLRENLAAVKAAGWDTPGLKTRANTGAVDDVAGPSARVADEDGEPFGP